MPTTTAPRAFKTLEWSYPTSTNAKKHGKEKTGGWGISVTRQSETNPNHFTTEEALSLYDDKADAITAGNTIDLPWWEPSLKYHPEIAASLAAPTPTPEEEPAAPMLRVFYVCDCGNEWEEEWDCACDSECDCGETVEADHHEPL